MGFAAVNTGNNLLFLIVSALLGFMAISGLAGWLNLRALKVDIDFPDEIYDGRETLAIVRLENRKRRFPSFLLKVRALDTEALFHIVERNSVETGALTVRFRGRGKRLLERVQVSSVFPINFFVRRKGLSLHAGFTVFPAPGSCEPARGAGPRDARGNVSSARRGYGGDVATIRDYTGREPMKLIHWRLSARHQQLKVKDLTAPAENPLILDVLALPGGTLEENLSCATFLVNRAMRTGRAVGMKLGTRLIAPDTTRQHRLRLLTELAEYGKH